MYTDLLGTQLAYEAYSNVQSMDSQLILPGLEYTRAQLFWLAKFRQHYEYSDTFSQVSVLPFINSKNFTDDFECEPGISMNPVAITLCPVL